MQNYTFMYMRFQLTLIRHPQCALNTIVKIVIFAIKLHQHNKLFSISTGILLISINNE